MNRQAVVDLAERLSNPRVTTLFQSLASRGWHKIQKQHQPAATPQPDGRRQYGSVGKVVVKVLELADGDMRVKDIHARVEYFLGGDRVSRSSVKSFLNRGSKREVPIFEYGGPSGAGGDREMMKPITRFADAVGAELETNPAPGGPSADRLARPADPGRRGNLRTENRLGCPGVKTIAVGTKRPPAWGGLTGGSGRCGDTHRRRR